MNILLWAPNAMLARALMRGLVEDGAQVCLATDLAQAKQLAEVQPYAAIVLDVPAQMQIALLQHWRRSGIRTPVLFLSVPGYCSSDLNSTGLGPAAIIEKPFAFDDVILALRQLSNSSADEQQFPERQLRASQLR